jgi:hypothetical protein
MKTKILTTLLGLAILAVPAAVPASQPADVRLDQLAPATAVSRGMDLPTLLADPYAYAGELKINFPAGHTTLDWINADPFAR